MTATNNFYVLVFYPQDSPWQLSEEGVKGLSCLLNRKQWNMNNVMMQSRECYLQVLSGAENVSFLDEDEDDDNIGDGDYFESDSDDELD